VAESDAGPAVTECYLWLPISCPLPPINRRLTIIKWESMKSGGLVGGISTGSKDARDAGRSLIGRAGGKPEERLHVRRINYASPGSADLADNLCFACSLRSSLDSHLLYNKLKQISPYTE
jgi:hypothetical protein